MRLHGAVTEEASMFQVILYGIAFIVLSSDMTLFVRQRRAAFVAVRKAGSGRLRVR